MSPNPELLRMEAKKQEARSHCAGKSQSHEQPGPRHDAKGKKSAATRQYLPKHEHAQKIHDVDRGAKMEADERKHEDGEDPKRDQPPTPEDSGHKCAGEKQNGDEDGKEVHVRLLGIVIPRLGVFARDWPSGL